MNGDHSTDEVIDWLNFYRSDFERVNISSLTEEKITYIWNSDENCITLKRKGKGNIEIKNIRVGWNRRTGFFKDLGSYKSISSTQDYSLLNFLQGEIAIYRQSFWLNRIEWLCDPAAANFSKIEVLGLAKQNGLRIPYTAITNSKRELCSIINTLQSSIVIKPLKEVKLFNIRQDTYFPLTARITKEDVVELPEFFLPSLIQKEILKEFEIRAFYLNEQFYSMAIFSQLDNLTEVDFRNYNYKRPNRVVPFTLPKNIEISLRNLMRELRLNTGSVDILKGKDGEYYFLEINPAGQFGMVSHPCNYNLEKKIAEYLIWLKNKQNEV